MNSLPYATVIEEGLNVKFWRYQAFEERLCVSNICALSVAQLQARVWRFVVHLHAIFWKKATSVSQFRYKDRSLAVYCNTHVRAERRAMSLLGRFVSYHLMNHFSLTDAVRDRFFVRIPDAYGTLQACHGFKFEQEGVFLYRSGGTILNPR